MPDPMDADELKLLLARAFDRAWALYYRPGRVTISSDVARPALANHLVQMAKDGVTKEGQLAAGGVLHLISLTPEEPGDLSA
jgi:hypothetical protein